MTDSIINCANTSEADVVLLAVPYDRTSSFGKGADRGPQPIIDCLHTQIEFYDRVSNSVPVDNLKIACRTLEQLDSCSPEEMVQLVCDGCAEQAERFTMLIGGEHSVTNGALRYHAARSSEITVVQIDAHADLRDDDSDYNDTPYGPYAHSAVMRRAVDLGFSIVQVGIRAYSADEQKLFSHPQVTVHEWSQNPPSIDLVLDSIKTESVYLTIDVDGFDPAVMPATGTPVPGGLTWYYCIELIKRLCQRHKLVGADIVEVAPRESDPLTEYCAAQLVYTIIGLGIGHNQV